MFTRKFWRDALERAARTAAQAAVTAFAGDKVNVWAVDWQTVTGLSLGAALLSVLMSLGARRAGDPDSASMVD
ncbi:MAG: holin [Mycobacterium sp.]